VTATTLDVRQRIGPGRPCTVCDYAGGGRAKHFEHAVSRVIRMMRERPERSRGESHAYSLLLAAHKLRTDVVFEHARALCERTIPKSVRKAVLRRDGHTCRWCGALAPLQIDHVEPWAFGGSGDIDNLQVLCASCNRLKWDHVPGDFLIRTDNGCLWLGWDGRPTSEDPTRS